MALSLWPDIPTAAEFAHRLWGDEALEQIMTHVPDEGFLQVLCHEVSCAIGESSSRPCSSEPAS